MSDRNEEQLRRRVAALKGHLQANFTAAQGSPADGNPYADLPLYGITGRLGFGQKVSVGWLYFSSALRCLLTARRGESIPGFSVSTLFEEQMRATPQNVAIKFEDAHYTYQEVEQAANKVAHWAHSCGITRGSVVALIMENRPEFIFTWLGLAKLGVVTAFINYRLHGKSLAHVMRISNAVVYIVGSELVDVFRQVAADVTTPSGAQALSSAFIYKGSHGIGDSDSLPLLDVELASQPDSQPDPAWRAGTDLNSELWYIYTSGTTGLPKAAKVVNRNVYQRTTMLRYMLQMTPEDTIYSALPLYHSSGSVISMAAWHVGASIGLRRSVSIKEFWNDCCNLGATVFIYIGEVCRYLLMQPDGPNDRKHKIRLAIGNGMNGDVWAKFQRRFQIPKICEFYGSTEGNAMMNLANKIGAVGYVPFPGKLIAKNRIIRYDVEKDEHIRGRDGLCIECSANEVGELVSKIDPTAVLSVTSGGQFMGYTDQGATDKKILRDVFERGDMYFRTGDLLRTDDDGFYYFVDRIGDTFRWKGENVSTNEVAEVLACFPGIGEAAVYGVAIPGYEGRAGMASLVLSTAPDTFSWSSLASHVDSQLPPYARPLFVRLQKEIAKTSTFKYSKVELMKEGFDPSKVHGDQLFFFSDARKTYVPLDANLFSKIVDGAVRL